MQLDFNVKEQTLTWVNKEKTPVADSVKYLTAKFTFSDEWTGIEKTATFFTADGKPYSQVLVDDGCDVPHEVIKAPLFKVSVAGGDLITTNIVIVNIIKSGYVKGETPKPPTPDVYAQILEIATHAEEIAETVADGENERVNAEKIRVSSETERVEAENIRLSNEQVRIESENSRQINEQNRIKAELRRETLKGELETLKEQTEQVVVNSQKSLEDFNQQAETKLENVQIATDNANNAADRLNESVDNMNNTFANILKGNISGEVINIDDVSPNEHTVKVKTSDTTATIKKCGKNLFPPLPEITAYGVTISKVEDYYVLNGTATSSSNRVIDTIFLPYGVYTLSAKNPQHNNLGNIPIIQIYSTALNASMDIYDKAVYGKQTKTLKASSDYQIRLRINKGTVYDNYIIKPQLEFGDIETEYEAFKGENITPLADGTVEFSSVSPTMTLFANKEGVMLDVEYNQDTNKVVDNIKADISKNSADIANIKSLWTGKTWLTYGDSITAMGNGNDASSGWQKYVSERLDLAGHYGRGIGGQTFTYNTKPWFANADGTLNSRNDNASMLDSSSYTVPEGCTAHYGYLSSWDRIITMISDDIKDSIDLIFLFGVNDASKITDFTFEPPTFTKGSTTDVAWASAEENTLGGDFDLTNFTGAVASTIMKLQARCPKAMIVFGTSWSGGSTSNNANSAEYTNQKIWKEGELVKQITNYFSIPCVDIWANSGVNPFNRSEYNQDNIHPYLTKGKQALARAVISGLMNIYPRFDVE